MFQPARISRARRSAWTRILAKPGSTLAWSCFAESRRGRTRHWPSRPFGFWVRLCDRPSEQGNSAGPRIWPQATGAFPYAPKADRNRTSVLQAFDEIRGFRNRVAHHHPLWDQNPMRLARAHFGADRMDEPGLGSCVTQHFARTQHVRGRTPGIPRSSRGNHAAVRLI